MLKVEHWASVTFFGYKSRSFHSCSFFLLPSRMWLKLLPLVCMSRSDSQGCSFLSAQRGCEKSVDTLRCRTIMSENEYSRNQLQGAQMSENNTNKIRFSSDWSKFYSLPTKFNHPNLSIAMHFIDTKTLMPHVVFSKLPKSHGYPINFTQLIKKKIIIQSYYCYYDSLNVNIFCLINWIPEENMLTSSFLNYLKFNYVFIDKCFRFYCVNEKKSIKLKGTIK